MDTIEKVARAICRADHRDPDKCDDISWQEIIKKNDGISAPTITRTGKSPPRWTMYTQQVEAAIGALSHSDLESEHQRIVAV